MSLIHFEKNLVMFSGTTNAIIQTGKYTVGDKANGGTVIYTWNGGFNGIVASNSLGNMVWGCNTTLISGSFDSSIGKGKDNTNLIISGCPTSPAATACTGYNGGGYTDWFLPSYYECIEIMKCHTYLGLTDDYFWSSNQYNSSNSYATYWNPSANGGWIDKVTTNQVIACRYF